jgi:hypothetical protein
MLIQCGHELQVFGFKMGEWSNRWYSNSTYCEQVQNLFRTGFFSSSTAVATEPEGDDDDVMVADDECVADVINMFSDRQVRVVQAEDGHDKDEVEEIPIVKFSEVISTFNAIASHVQNDQPELVKLLAFAKGVLKSYRKSLRVDIVVCLGGVGGCEVRRYFFRKVFGRRLAAKSISWVCLGGVVGCEVRRYFFRKLFRQVLYVL